MTEKSADPFDFNDVSKLQDDLKPADLYLPGMHPIDAFGNHGFRFAEMSHQGSLLVLPSGVSSWHIANDDKLILADMVDILAQAELVDILVLGTGDKMYRPSAEILAAFKAVNIVIEFMSTSKAARTFNVLLAEDRRVAAALVAIG